MSGFSIDWLDLREGADRRARADKLLEQARHWLQSDAAPQSQINGVDLGAGTGSTLRAFSAASGSNKDSLSWHLVDQDALLLAQARLRHGDSHQLQTHELDLTDIAALPLEGVKLITASALFEPLSEDFIDRLAPGTRRRRQPQAVGLSSARTSAGRTTRRPAQR